MRARWYRQDRVQQLHERRIATPLEGKVALVTGTSRGVGKGIALGLGEAGATVYITARTTAEGTSAAKLPGTIHATAAEVDAIGGHGIAIQCDHRDDAQVSQVFGTIASAYGRLDILVNNVRGGYEHYSDSTNFFQETGFWTMPLSRWDSMFDAGVRAQYTASALAVPMMGAGGLIVNLSFFAASRSDRGVIYRTAKRASDHMAACMAFELQDLGIAAVSLYPGSSEQNRY